MLLLLSCCCCSSLWLQNKKQHYLLSNPDVCRDQSQKRNKAVIHPASSFENYNNIYRQCSFSANNPFAPVTRLTKKLILKIY